MYTHTHIYINLDDILYTISVHMSNIFTLCMPNTVIFLMWSSPTCLDPSVVQWFKKFFSLYSCKISTTGKHQFSVTCRQWSWSKVSLHELLQWKITVIMLMFSLLSCRFMSPCHMIHRGGGVRARAHLCLTEGKPATKQKRRSANLKLCLEATTSNV